MIVQDTIMSSKDTIVSRRITKVPTEVAIQEKVLHDVSFAKRTLHAWFCRVYLIRFHSRIAVPKG